MELFSGLPRSVRPGALALHQHCHDDAAVTRELGAPRRLDGYRSAPPPPSRTVALFLQASQSIWRMACATRRKAARALFIHLTALSPKSEENASAPYSETHPLHSETIAG